MSEHQERADELESELEDMEERSERLEDEIDDTRQDWESKKADPSVPGAPPDDSED
jgi:predicted  nucleic acid-binding Zn-ribbon protein